MNGHTVLDDQAWQIAGSIAVTPGDKPGYRSLKPVHPFDPGKGHYGAVEVAARYSELSIDDASFEAGITAAKNSVQKAREITVGVNWHFNDYIKLQLNYSLTAFTPFEGGEERPSEHLIATRLQASI